jgi:hypothetical protein
MSDHDDLHKTLMKVTARAIALETLLLAVIAHSTEKIKILNAFEHEMEQQSTRTLIESEMKDHPDKDLPVAYDHLLVQVAALCTTA